MIFRKKVEKQTYNKENQKPIIRSSICTGEKVAGFKDIHTGKFTEIMLIRNDNDMKVFLTKYDIIADEVRTEW